VTYENLGTGSLAANTHYYLKNAGCTVSNCSNPTSEASLTTANDGASHMILETGTAKVGHTSYAVFCSTSSGAEAQLTAPFTGAYSGNGYVLPVMGCSGSGSPNTVDLTGNVAPAGGYTQPCSAQLSQGGNAISAGTYTVPFKFTCRNVWNGTTTVASVAMAVDSGSASTCNLGIYNGSGLVAAVLTGAITGVANAFTAGTLSGTPTIPFGDWINWTIVADGTAEIINCQAVLSHSQNN
jgi:hypothetical protein